MKQLLTFSIWALLAWNVTALTIEKEISVDEEAEVPAAIVESTSPTIVAGVDFNSAYVFHGMTYNSGLVLQPFLQIAGKSFVYTMWSNYNLQSDDNGLGHFKAAEFTEVDHFFTYLLPVSFVDADITAGFYTYPYLGWECDKEIQFGLEKTFHSLLVPYARLGYMYDGLMKKNIYIEFGAKGSQPIGDSFSFDYNAKASWESQGFIDPAPKGMKHVLITGGFTYMQSETLGFTAKANYVGQLNKDVMPDALYDVNFHASLGLFKVF